MTAQCSLALSPIEFTTQSITAGLLLYVINTTTSDDYNKSFVHQL